MARGSSNIWPSSWLRRPFSLLVVVGAFVGLNEDHRGVGPLSQDPYFSYKGFSALHFVVFVGALIVLIVSAASAHGPLSVQAVPDGRLNTSRQVEGGS